MKNVEFHFALEGISGKGKNLIAFKKLKYLKMLKFLDSQNITWSKLYKTKNSKTISYEYFITGGAGYVGSKLVPKNY